jgi:hypothetical protein
LAIRPSASKEISALVSDLASDRVVVREAAVARLTVIGARAAMALAALAGDRRASANARAASLRVLEATAAPQAVAPAVSTLDEPDDEIVKSAIAALRPHVRTACGAAIVDRLTAIALDQQRRVPVREAALRALFELDKGSLRPLLKELRKDASPDIAALAAGARTPPEEPSELVANAVDGRLPSDGEALRRAVVRAGSSLTLPDALTLIERIHTHEKSLPAGSRGHWQAARGAAHLVLARRGSRLALYDLRETVQRAKEPLAVDFIAALDAIGDASCLEPLARAYAATRDDWWRDHLGLTFRTIVRRERLTRRHAAVRKLRERDPRLLDELWGRPG